MKTVSELNATDVSLECPHCGEEEYGFIGDPRGTEFQCDSCGQEYKVHTEADVDIL